MGERQADLEEREGEVSRRNFTRNQKEQIVERSKNERGEIVPCTVDGCKGNASRSARGSRGWCVMHYARWRRHGDPGKTLKAPDGEARSFYENVVLPFDNTECLIWPFGRYPSGYGYLHNTDGSSRVSRIACEDVNGPPPTDDHQAAHTCGNGHNGCCNPKHLYWATPQENQMDRVAHGTVMCGSNHPMSKLKDADILAIRSLAGTATHKELGKRFGVSKSTIGNVLRGNNWGHL